MNFPDDYLIPGIEPYHVEKAGIIYCADCRDILPHLPKVDLVLTDPPYPDYYTEKYGYQDGVIYYLGDFTCHQFIFWSAKVEFPLDYTAIHIWDKKTGCASQYEKIFERNGSTNYKVFSYYLINSTVAASYSHDIYTGHPSQKPIKLIKQLIGKESIILDPFLGSGTTAVAAKELGRRFIGIEISEEYCAIAKRRLRQGVLNF